MHSIAVSCSGSARSHIQDQGVTCSFKNLHFGAHSHNFETWLLAASLWIKQTDAPNSNFIGVTTLHVSGSLSANHQEFLAVHQLWYILCSCDDRLLPGAGWNCYASQLHKMYQSRCTAKNSWWWAERLPETCRAVIPIKLEFGASVCFIHKESVRMHGHTIIK